MYAYVQPFAEGYILCSNSVTLTGALSIILYISTYYYEYTTKTTLFNAISVSFNSLGSKL